ncbi:MAG: cytochrome C oxidase subunit IV family protein [bacterium]
MTDKPDFKQEEQVDEHVASLEPNYVGVFWWLVGLTIAEILVAVVPVSPMFPKIVQSALLVSMALGKASLVGLYFMHLKFEKRTLGVIALTPLMLCTLLIFALLPDLTGTNRQSKDTEVAKVRIEQPVVNVSEITEAVNK